MKLKTQYGREVEGKRLAHLRAPYASRTQIQGTKIACRDDALNQCCDDVMSAGTNQPNVLRVAANKKSEQPECMDRHEDDRVTVTPYAILIDGYWVPALRFVVRGVQFGDDLVLGNLRSMTPEEAMVLAQDRARKTDGQRPR